MPADDTGELVRRLQAARIPLSEISRRLGISLARVRQCAERRDHHGVAYDYGRLLVAYRRLAAVAGCPDEFDDARLHHVSTAPAAMPAVRKDAERWLTLAGDRNSQRITEICAAIRDYEPVLLDLPAQLTPDAYSQTWFGIRHALAETERRPVT